MPTTVKVMTAVKAREKKAPTTDIQDSWRSAIYEGTVRHRRYTPRYHEFTYRVFMVYLDLQEMDAVFKQTPLWSNGGFSLSWFRRKDFFDGKKSNHLYDAIANYVETETGSRPSGAIRMLTNLRYFGFIINPITCYYCFDKAGEIVETVVAEVTNTPWGERCHYILNMNKDSDGLTDTNDNKNIIENSADSSRKMKPVTVDKAMHVSPFQPMNLVYQWRGKQPATQLAIHLDVFDADDMSQSGDAKSENPTPVFDATLLLERQPMTKKTMNKRILCYPFMTIKVFVSIYWQALKLWWKRIPFYSAPDYKPANDDK
jgi:DUF1365 family protein